MIVDRRRQGGLCIYEELKKMHVPYMVTGDKMYINSPIGLIEYNVTTQAYIIDKTRRIGSGLVSLLAKCM